MIGVLIIPTGIGCEIGGHSGDSNPVVKLIGACCDKLITHPNAVNGSDVNEMPENALYVEGSILDRFLAGEIKLKEVRQNKILVVTNSPVRNDTINAVSSARATIGTDAEILELKTPLIMRGVIENDRATGTVSGCAELIKQVKQYDFDALAIHTPIDVDRDVVLNYYENGGVNPWGGVEAKASKLIANILNKPVAHAPIESNLDSDDEVFNMFLKVVDPRMAAEAISICHLHSVLKGLNKAPRPSVEGISNEDIDFMVSPYGCWGKPHEACLNNNILIIVVEENKTVEYLCTSPPQGVMIVENYWEVAGFIMSMKAGISPKSVRRPLEYTKVARMKNEDTK